VRLVLASRSPQRRAILEALGVAFEVREPHFEEVTLGEGEQVALANALGKARSVARAEHEVVLGVDTVVTLGGRLYGKPADAGEARATLAALAGRTHAVISAVALVGLDAAPQTTVARTAVRFRDFDDATLDWYLARGEWRERAGGYAIQGAGAALAASLEGDHTNVVGLPVPALLALWPALLAECNSDLGAPDGAQLQQ
jgi:septum formation protein